MRRNRQELASVNEALTSWLEPKRLVNKLADTCTASCSRVKQLKWMALVVFVCYRFHSLNGKRNCMECAAMTKGQSCQTWYCLRRHSQVVNKLVNKSFWLEPAGQRFVKIHQFLAILSHRISMERLPDPFFPYPNTKGKKSGLATRDYPLQSTLPPSSVYWNHGLTSCHQINLYRSLVRSLNFPGIYFHFGKLK